MELDSALIRKHVPYENKGDEWAAVATPTSANDTPRAAPSPTRESDLDDLPF